MTMHVMNCRADGCGQGAKCVWWDHGITPLLFACYFLFLLIRTREGKNTLEDAGTFHLETLSLSLQEPPLLIHT